MNKLISFFKPGEMLRTDSVNNFFKQEGIKEAKVIKRDSGINAARDTDSFLYYSNFNNVAS